MLEIKNLYKSFQNNGFQKNVLQDVSFQVADGEFLCILGASGSGKTTLLRCIAGYEPLTEGEISLNKQRITRPGTDRIMVFQGFEQLFAWKTLYANVEYPLFLKGINKRQRHEQVQYYLDMVDLWDYRFYYPHQLSGGMKQRTAIARGLALEPQVLLMDEPFGHLDAQTRNALQIKLLDIWKKVRSTILFVTHDIEEALLLSDRILLLSKAGTVKKTMPNPIDRPRKPGMHGLGRLWDELYADLLD